MSGGVLDYARSYHDAGLSVVPVKDGQKIPLKGWIEYAERPQRRDELDALFSRDENNIAIIGGSVSRNLLVLDVDSREKWKELSKSALFRKLKATTPIHATRRGYHMYLFGPEPIASTKCPRWKTDILAERGSSLAPPSKVEEKNGDIQLYLWSKADGDGFMLPIYTPDRQEFDVLSELFGLVPYEKSAELEASHLLATSPVGGVFYGLGRQVMEILTHPREKGERSDAEQGVVLRAAGIGWDFEEILALFNSKAAKGTKFQDKKAEGAERKWLWIGYKNALRYLEKTMTERQRKVIAAIETLARYEGPFRERTRFTDSDVLCAILKTEREIGRNLFRISYRAISERTGSAAATVVDAVSRLAEKGYITVKRLPDADTYPMFGVPESALDGLLAKSNILTQKNSSGVGIGLLAIPNILTQKEWGSLKGSSWNIGLPSPQHDAYRQKALGAPGPHLVRLLNELEGGRFSVSDLMQRGFAYRYIERALSLLERAGIVEVAEIRKLKHGRPQRFYKARRIGFDGLAKIAELAGTKGEHERQKRRYREEREEYAAHCSK